MKVFKMTPAKVETIGANKEFENCITFTNGCTLSSLHETDCCEMVYADFEALKDTPFEDETFDKLVIENIENQGIKINGYFVPCYDIQNGSYSNNLSLVFKCNDLIDETSISHCTNFKEVE